MASEAVRIVREYFTGYWAGDSTVINKHLANDYIMWGGDNKPRAQGRDQAASENGQEYSNAFPDLEVKIEEIIGSRNRVIVRWSAKGTHLGEFGGHRPTGRSVQAHGMHLFKLRGKKIVEERYSYDSLDLYEQLGVLHR